MTLEGKFIQKKGARKVIIGIIVCLMIFSLSMVMTPLQYEKMVVHKMILKSRMTKFSLVDTLLHIVTSYGAYFD